MAKATYRGKRWYIGNERLTLSEEVVFLPVLLRKFTDREMLIELLFSNPDNQPEWADNLIGVHVHNINKKLKRAGCEFKIKSDGRRRYSLVKYPVQAGSA